MGYPNKSIPTIIYYSYVTQALIFDVLQDSKRSSPPKSTGITRLSTISEINVEDVFNDSQTFYLPKSIKAEDWKRPSELFQNVPNSDFFMIFSYALTLLPSRWNS